MLAPDLCFGSAMLVCWVSSLTGSSGLFAYGPAPGMELIPYLLSLVVFAGFAITSVLLWPITALMRRLRRSKQSPETVSRPAGEGDADRV